MPAIYYDVTHLRHNAVKPRTSGVIRLDLEMAAHFFRPGSDARAIQYGVAGPSVVQDVPALRSVIADAIERRRGGGSTPNLQTAVTWLRGSDRAPLMARPRSTSSTGAYARFLTPPSWLRGNAIEAGSAYLNTAQHALAYPMFFGWLKARRDIRSVFFVHDLLPLDYPEFWRGGYADRFQRAIRLLAQVACRFVVTSEAVRERLAVELRRLGRPDVDILQSTPPVFLRPSSASSAADAELGSIPYFVMLGTIEPRKNHLLVLNIWRQLVERGGPVPKLILIGSRGWENEQVIDLLERSPMLRGRVLELANVSDVEACRLIGNARALLFPSFAEGFGMPVAEALALGTPVIASNIPVLRETSKGKAFLLDPLDGPGWTEAILRLADRSGPTSRQARASAAEFKPRAAEAFLSDIEAFLAKP